MTDTITAYPLTYPNGWTRTPKDKIARSRFGKAHQPVSTWRASADVGKVAAMIIPRVGDVWEFRTSKRHKTIKTIKAIQWRASRIDVGTVVPFIVWSHTPKARYIADMRVKPFLRYWAVRLVRRKTQTQRRAPKRERLMR